MPGLYLAGESYPKSASEAISNFLTTTYDRFVGSGFGFFAEYGRNPPKQAINEALKELKKAEADPTRESAVPAG
jgi:hypothetical protein